jgi:hypothetical protein
VSVVTDSTCDYFSGFAKECQVCHGQVPYPFLAWESVRICGRCCHSIRKGFTADLIHVAAAFELKKLGYPDEVLIRTTRRSNLMRRAAEIALEARQVQSGEE